MEYMNEKPVLENAVATPETKTGFEDVKTEKEGLEAMERQNEKTMTPVAKEKGVFAKIGQAIEDKTREIKASIAKAKEEKFLNANEYKINLWKNQGYIFSEEDKKELLAKAKADKYKGELGTNKVTKKIDYRPVDSISYSGGENSGSGPTAGA